MIRQSPPPAQPPKLSTVVRERCLGLSPALVVHPEVLDELRLVGIDLEVQMPGVLVARRGVAHAERGTARLKDLGVDLFEVVRDDHVHRHVLPAALGVIATDYEKREAEERYFVHL